MMIRTTTHSHSGFTLLEVILYVGIVSVLLLASVQFVWNVIYSRERSHVQQVVSQNVRFVTQRITYELRNASGIAGLTPTTICLRSADPARDPTSIYRATNQIWIGWGGGSPTCASTTFSQPLTSSDIIADALTFQNLSSSDVSAHVRFSLTLSSHNPSNRPEWSLTRSSTTSVELRDEIP